MACTTLTLEVTTPLFNGGAELGGNGGSREDQEAGVRVASIRGAMRFWFRALTGCLTGPDLRLLAGLERRVFGGISGSGSGDERATPSPLLLRIPEQPPLVPPAAQHSFLPPRHIPLRDRRQDESRWILYLMGQGLADLAKFELKRPYVAPGRTFELKIGFRHTPTGPATGDDAETRAAIEALAVTSLWLTCAYGGIGARTRRGFGGVRIIAAEGTGAGRTLPLPEPWNTPENLLTPELAHYEGLRALWPSGPVAACMPYMRTLSGGRAFDSRRAWEGTIPSFPVLSRNHAPAATSGRHFTDWQDTLIHAGEQFRRFRADTPNPGAMYHPPIETHEWGETVHGYDDGFALGALGLPVGYQSRQQKYVVNVVDAEGTEPLRRASPLWLRAVGEGDRYRLLSFAFQTQFLPGPNAPTVRLSHDSAQIKELMVTDDDVRRQTNQWIAALGRGETFRDGHRRA